MFGSGDPSSLSTSRGPALCSGAPGRGALSAVVGVLVFPQCLQNAGPELGAVLVLQLLEPQSLLELRGMEPQEGVVGLLVPDGGRTLEGPRGKQREHGPLSNGWR